MHTPRPSLLVIVPDHWEAVPEGVQEMKGFLADEWGGTVIIRSTAAPLSSPLILPTGVWTAGTWRTAPRDIELMILPQAFFSLD